MHSDRNPQPKNETLVASRQGIYRGEHGRHQMLIAVGSSLYGMRASRQMLPGFVTFLDRAYNRVSRLHLPAAPTQIRRLGGHDLSLSMPR